MTAGKANLSAAGATPGVTPGPGLVVCAPLLPEARAVRRGIGDGGEVRVSGYGPERARRQAGRLRQDTFGALAIAGTGGGLTGDLTPGDLVVATEVTDGAMATACPSAVLLAGELRRAGLTAAAGPVVSVRRLAGGRERARAVEPGALAVDMESAWLAGAAGGRPVAVVRAISDTPERPLRSPAALAGGLRALRSLRAAGPALTRWAAAAGQRRVLLAGPRSFCAGVERAIEIVEKLLEQQQPPVYVRKQIVHNTHVVADLERRGAVFVDELSEVPDGACVVFSAHGVSPAVREEADRRGLVAVDATCPLVSKVHAEARRFAADGYLVALIGHAGHEEVEGTLGEAPEAMALVETADDVARLSPPDPGKVAYLMQTTLAVDEAEEVAGALRERFPAARAPGSDDICYATTNRQQAVRAVATESDLVLVAGSANSSNSLRLVETAERAGVPAHLIDGPGDIELGWLAGVSTVGISAGASAPPAMVGEIVAALAGLGPVEVAERVTTTESIRFSLPKEVRSP
ncbi:MAG TPA: 4-hydroxy-3-methylbut-2-enyl diphosphate reductase [Streptosporangiaceae bacterium]|nr:4-hydroxy-3-methylbut-2-enyl diphosphate reductase [Streptosporangiaceae bacterium]